MTTMPSIQPWLAHHFDTPEQQFSSAKLGMWAFLLTEVLFFSGLFCAYAVFRRNHPELFVWTPPNFLNTILARSTRCVLSSAVSRWPGACVAPNCKTTATWSHCLIVTLLCAGVPGDQVHRIPARSGTRRVLRRRPASRCTSEQARRPLPQRPPHPHHRPAPPRTGRRQPAAPKRNRRRCGEARALRSEPVVTSLPKTAEAAKPKFATSQERRHLLQHLFPA